ncbi:MAG: cob(I)yrinic acid a,c-diamide adenosyltransferase [Coriobacteriia bacterium]|nr:cob(I)yrinic acid a,c-diamide adenosyltransferase [Coriobacteriia bacterium]
MSGPIYTRDGDDGQTSLADGTRVPKDSLRVEAYGTLDEANAAIGLVRSSLQLVVDEEAVLDRMLEFVQQRLMSCASRVATPEEAVTEATPRVTQPDIDYLERSIDQLASTVDAIDHFVLPTGCEEAARLHVARTVTRRAERKLVQLSQLKPVDPTVLKFVNRLSDLLFVAARYANAVYGASDVYWNPAD